MKCPKCGYDNKDGADHCDLCKEILVKPPEFGRPTTERNFFSILSAKSEGVVYEFEPFI